MVSTLELLQDRLRKLIIQAAKARDEKAREELLRRAKEIDRILRERGLDRAAEKVLREMEKQRLVKVDKKGEFKVTSNLEYLYDSKRSVAVGYINRAIRALEEARDLLFSDAAQFAYPRKNWKLKVKEAYLQLKELGSRW